MPTDNDPIVGNWYVHTDKGQEFQVVAFDEDRGTIDIQHFDGDLEEVDLETWYTLDIESGAEPENWSGAQDIGEPDDYGTEITDTSVEDWEAPLQEIKPGREQE